MEHRAEGQFFLGAFGASLVVLARLFPKDLPPGLIFRYDAFRNVFWRAVGFIPGYLKAKLGVNEIISTLMLNYIAVAWNNFFLFGKWSYQGFQMSEKFPKKLVAPSFGYRQEIQYQSVTGNGITFGHYFCACNSNHYVLCYI
jgi:simple sugar transport system permease protein